MLRNFFPGFIFAWVFLLLFPPAAQAQKSGGYPPYAILAASLSGDEGIAREILAAGVDPDVRTERGDTALHLAMFQGNIGIAKLLLDHGFDPNARNLSGETPLHRAVAVNNIHAAELLLQYRADRNIRNSSGRTPLDEASRNAERRQMIFLLR